MAKITVIGAGSVGATVANDLMIQGLASEIVLVDVNKKKALGEALDIYQGAPFCSPAIVRPGDYADAAGSKIVVITCGVARKPGMSRLDLAQTNVNILKDVAAGVVPHAPDAIYVIVSNPVDVLTYVFHKISGIPANRIIGSGTILDTSRVRSYLAKHFDISQQNIHTHVLGEHGDSSFIPWSQASVSTVDIEKYAELVKAHGVDVPPLDREAVEEYVRSSGAQIIARKGATYYAVAVATVHICKCIFGDNDTALTVSTMLCGEYGISDVCLSLLTVVGQEGVKFRIPSHLSDEELQKLRHSADCLRKVIDQIKF